MLTECPHCQWSTTVENEYKGVESDCPSCREAFTIKEVNPSYTASRLLPIAGKDNRKIKRVNTEVILMQTKTNTYTEYFEKKSLHPLLIFSLITSLILTGIFIF